MSGESVDSPAAPTASRWRAVAEIILITLLFAAAGAWPTPDTNEAHYLTKARHSANPSWGAGDFFLETPEAHGVFYRLLGPVAAALPLAEAAWIGRWFGWLALAAGWWHLSRGMLPTGVGRLLGAALFSLAVRHTPAAGEWVIGGCEAKVFAWALVLWGVGEGVRGRFSSAWLSCGAATALHPLVGGWAMVALVAGVVFPEAVMGGGKLVTWSPATLGWTANGLILAAMGVLPALELSAGATQAEKNAATITYVAERLPHHLLVRTFADGLVDRHLLAILLWLVLLRLVPASSARSRLTGFTAAAIGIAIGGSALGWLEYLIPTAGQSLLRFYWFRLADGMVPVALALTAAEVLCWTVPTQPSWWRGIVATVVAGMLGVDVVNESRHWPLPGRPLPLARSDTKVQAEAWQDACRWVRDNAPPEACFLTPRGAASFLWHTGRREVVAWKNVPQDPGSILQWRQRIVDCFSPDGSLRSLANSTAELGVERMRQVAARYGADYGIVPASLPGLHDLPWPVLYANDGYVVLGLEEAEATPPLPE